MKIIKKNKKNKNSKNINKNKIAICLLGYQPKEELLELYDGLYKGDKYDIYVVVDDSNFDISHLMERFPNFIYIKIKEELCYELGYTHLAFTVKKGEPSAWDKGVLYFCEICKIKYSYIWFIEDDVFIPKSDTLKNIDDKYGDADLLVKEIKKNKNINIPYEQLGELDKYMNPELKPFLTKSMICAIRVSRSLIEKIKKYTNKNKKLFFSEYFFITLASYSNLKIVKINELKNIIYRKIWTIDDVFKNQDTLFHPVKDISLQKSFRKTLQPNDAYFLLKRVFKKKLLENSDVVLKSMNLLQIIIFKNEKGSVIKVIQETSINDNILYIEIEKKYKNNVFTFKINIKSMEEINTFLSILKYKFVAYQNIIREHFTYKKNTNIYLTNIPGVIEFVHFESNSDINLKNAYNQLGYNDSEVKTLNEAINASDEIFGTKTDLESSLEFEKYKKALKYVKKNKKLYSHLTENQYKLFKSIINLFGDKIKIFDRINFISNE